jgi:hypothetical protein
LVFRRKSDSWLQQTEKRNTTNVLELNALGRKFKDASVFYNSVSEINIKDLKRWLDKAKKIQWDYKNIVKRKGKLQK